MTKRKVTLSLEQHCPLLLPLPSWLRGRQTLFARSPAGQWRWGLWKCVGDIWQVEKIFIFMGTEQEIQRRSYHRNFKQETDAQTRYSVFGWTRQNLKSFVAFTVIFALLNNLNGGLLKRGISFLPRLQESITGDLPGACCHRPPLLPLFPARIQSHFLWFLCLGPIGVSSLVLIGRPVQSGHLGKWFLGGGINN